MLSTRPLMSAALPAPSMMVVFSFSTRIFFASPKSFSVAFSRDRPTSSEMTVPPVRIAMSCNIALRRSPKLGALALLIVDEVRREITAIELHAFDHFELVVEARALFNRDHALFADFRH